MSPTRKAAPQSVVAYIEKMRATVAGSQAKGRLPDGTHVDGDVARAVLGSASRIADMLARIVDADCMAEAWLTLERHKASTDFAIRAAADATCMEQGVFDWWKKSPKARSGELQLAAGVVRHLAAWLANLPSSEFEASAQCSSPLLIVQGTLNRLARDLEGFEHFPAPVAARNTASTTQVLAMKFTGHLLELTGYPLADVAAKTIEATTGVKVDARRIREWRAATKRTPAGNRLD